MIVIVKLMLHHTHFKTLQLYHSERITPSTPGPRYFAIGTNFAAQQAAVTYIDTRNQSSAVTVITPNLFHALACAPGNHTARTRALQCLHRQTMNLPHQISLALPSTTAPLHIRDIFPQHRPPTSLPSRQSAHPPPPATQLISFKINRHSCRYGPKFFLALFDVSTSVLTPLANFPATSDMYTPNPLQKPTPQPPPNNVTSSWCRSPLELIL